MTALARSYGDFSSAVHGRARAARLPVNGTIEVTHRCPLACAHCYNNLPVGDAEARRGELTTAELCRIIDEIADARQARRARRDGGSGVGQARRARERWGLRS